MRYLQPVAEYQQAATVTDPTTGMTFGYIPFIDTRANKIFTLQCLYGFAPAKTTPSSTSSNHKLLWSSIGIHHLSREIGGGVLFEIRVIHQA
jgi:hypothetical protein